MSVSALVNRFGRSLGQFLGQFDQPLVRLMTRATGWTSAYCPYKYSAQCIAVQFLCDPPRGRGRGSTSELATPGGCTGPQSLKDAGTSTQYHYIRSPPSKQGG